MCCGTLEHGAEYESDVSLVAMMKMQDLMWRVDVMIPETGSDELPSVTLATRTAMSTLQTELEEIKDSVPTSIKKDRECRMPRPHQAATVCC